MARPKKDKGTGNFKEYLIGELKKDPEFASEYLNAAIEDGTQSVFLMALGDLARAKGISVVSKKTGLNRENIYRIVSTDGNPNIKSVFALLKAFGLTLKTEPVKKVSRQTTRKPVKDNVVQFAAHAEVLRRRGPDDEHIPARVKGVASGGKPTEAAAQISEAA